MNEKRYTIAPPEFGAKVIQAALSNSVVVRNRYYFMRHLNKIIDTQRDVEIYGSPADNGDYFKNHPFTTALELLIQTAVSKRLDASKQLLFFARFTDKYLTTPDDEDHSCFFRSFAWLCILERRLVCTESQYALNMSKALTPYLLVRCGQNTERDKDGDTILTQLLSMDAGDKLLSFVVESGIDLESARRDGITPYSLAISKKRTFIAELILKQMSKNQESKVISPEETLRR